MSRHRITSITVATHEASRPHEYVAFLRDNSSEPCHSYFLSATSDSFWRSLRALRLLAMRKHVARPDAPSVRDDTLGARLAQVWDDYSHVTPPDAPTSDEREQGGASA